MKFSIKNLLSVAVCCCFFSTAARAQFFFEPVLEYRINKYGLSRGYAEDAYSPKGLGGIGAGAGMGMYLLNQRVMVSVRPTFIQQGSWLFTEDNYVYTKKDGTETIGYFEIKEKYPSVRIPIEAKVKIFGERFGMTAGIGMAFHANLKGKGNVIATDLVTGKSSDFETFDIEFGKRTDFYKKNYMTLLLSPGFFYNLDEDGVLQLNLNMNFERGMQDMISDDYRKLFTVNGTQKQNATTFSLGLKVCLACL